MGVSVVDHASSPTSVLAPPVHPKHHLRLVDLLRPNEHISQRVFVIMSLFWTAFFLFMGWAGHLKILPSPVEVIQALPGLWRNDGLGQELYTSIVLNIQAVLIMTVLSLTIAYLTVVPLARPIGMFAAFARFNGMVGLPLIFTLMLGNAHQVKIALLVYGMSTFTIPSVQKMIESIPREFFDHARTLRMSEARVTWEVVVLGRFDDVIDILSTNIAFGWVMLPMVEGMFKFEGGVGSLIVNENKHFHLASVFCIVLLIGFCGLFQDYVIGILKRLVCPYSALGLEAR